MAERSYGMAKKFGEGGGPRRGGKAKFYSDEKAGGARTGAVYSPKMMQFPFPMGGGGGAWLLYIIS